MHRTRPFRTIRCRAGILAAAARSAPQSRPAAVSVPVIC